LLNTNTDAGKTKVYIHSHTVTPGLKKCSAPFEVSKDRIVVLLLQVSQPLREQHQTEIPISDCQKVF